MAGKTERQLAVSFKRGQRAGVAGVAHGEGIAGKAHLLTCGKVGQIGFVERQRQADAVATYRQTMEKEDEKEIEEKWRQANEYNEMLFQAKGGIVEETEEKKYEELLNIHGTDIMGSLEIPKIQVELPIYHGTEDEVLSNGIGHLEGTSLPIGGENTHSVLTGHRGLPSSKLLVRLDEMKIGDLFFIHTYKEVMAYKVEEIMVVKPEDTAWMEIKGEKDLVSLVTCTPFGINSHRLIVTGHRVDYKEKEYIKIKPQLPSVREIIVTVFPILFVVSIVVIEIKNRIQTYRRQRRRKRREKNR